MASKKRRGDPVEAEIQFLLKLSDCCAAHAESSHAAAKPLRPLTERDALPEKCQRDMASLCSILPKVEKTYGVEKNPHPALLPHLCDFYQSVVQGRFCPHAPLLLEWGKGGTAVLPRIFYLFQHLTSKAISSNAVAALKTAESAPVANVICATTAELMSFIPSQNVQECLVRDLFHLSLDLAVIGQVLESGEKSAQVSILEESAVECKLKESYVLTFNNMDSLYVTWSGTLQILAALFSLLKKKRMSLTFEETAESYEMTTLPTANADSYWSFVLDDGDLLSTALASIRQVLLSLPSKAKASLVTRTTVSAAKLLNMLLEDWESLSVSQPLMTQVALLVSRAVRVHFRTIAERREKDNQLSTQDDLELSRLFATLICNAIIFPSATSDTFAIRATVLNELLDCLPLLPAVAKESPFVKDDVILAHVVLRAIHSALYTPSDGDNTHSLITAAVNHWTIGGIFPSLFHLLHNAHLGDVAAMLISSMLSADTSVDVPGACRLAQNLFEKEIAGAERLSAASELTSPRGGSSGSKKRGRSSSQVSPYRSQLQIERSPKRSRGGGTTHATLATPSPPSWPNAASSEASATGSSAVSSRSNGSCHESLGSTLLSALLNAKYILGMVDPCRTLFAATRASPASSAEHNNDGVSKAIVSVSDALRLLFSLFANKCDHQRVDDERSKAILQVASLLAKSLKAVAVSVSSHCKTIKDDDIPDAAFRSINCLIRVGLVAIFTVGRVLVDFPKIHRDTITECLDAISVCAREIWTIYLRALGSAATEMPVDGAESSKRQPQACDGTCCKLKGALSCYKSGSSDWLPCLCKLIRLPAEFESDAPASSDRRYQSDCSTLLLEQLSIEERCALLSCLRPMTSKEDIDAAVVAQPMGQIFSSSSSNGIHITQTMLSLSPLFALSAVLATSGNGSPAEDSAWDVMDSSANGGSSPLAHDFVRVISSCLGRLRYGKYLDVILKSEESALSTAAYVAADRTHELCDLTLRIAADESDSSPDTFSPFLREVLSSQLSVLAFILGCRFAPELTARNDESQWRRRDALYDSVQETYRSRRIALLSTCGSGFDDSLPADARIATWKCLSNTALRSTVSEMAQITSRKSAAGARQERSKMDDSLGLEGDETIDDGSATKNPLIWLLRSAFADESASFRFSAAKEIGRTLLSNSSSLLYALFSTPANWRRQGENIGMSPSGDESRHTASLEHVVIPLFLEIDRLLCRYCHVPQSQLSFTMGPSVISEMGSTMTKKDSSSTLSFQRSAIMVLSSLCQFADVESPCGLLVFEHAITRLIRLWTATENESQNSFEDLLGSVSISSLAFGEMVRLNELRSFRSVILKNSYDRFVPRLFSDILLSSAGMISGTGTAGTPGVLERENRERQFRLLLTFIGTFLVPTPTKLECGIKAATANGSYCMHCVEEFVDEVVPSVLSAFISVKDHDSLLTVIAFKLFVIGEKRKADKAAKKAAKSGTGTSGQLRDGRLGSSARAISPKTLGLDTSSRELAEQTKLQCLAPETIEHILPRILMANDSSQLLFFLEVVLQKKCSLHQMISSRHMLILKTIVVEFGRTGNLTGAEHALRTGAKARDNASLSDVAGSSGSKQGDDNTAVCLWVTSSFMYLLVNVVQLHWKTRTLLERIRALRSLKWVLKFLSPTEAPQYLPQIMATVNMAMGGECNSSELESGTWELRLLAIQALSDFVRTAIQSQYEMVGSNLATIVVSLFPVLSVDASVMNNESERSAFNEASKVAVDLLEWLTQGSNGQNLVLYFRDIPFLPPTKALDKVRDALKTHGVNFDNLHVFSQHALSVRGSLTSEGGTSNGDERNETVLTYSSSSLTALRRRLHVVRKLLSHENVSVRRVVLQHLIDLLRGNRGLFRRLVESDEGTSLNRFVTVSSGASDSSSGSVTSMVDSLLQLCCTEVDLEAKQLLATCLGEVGAISAHFLGETKLNPLQSELTGDDSSLWRLKQAPWQSRPVRYELKVVTNHLVIALKAATSSGDQHKIAFAIQQLLVLLDDHAKVSNRSESNYGQSLDKPARSQMSEWLREQLSESGVIETLEPFWCSEFNEIEQFSAKEPPFFCVASSYYAWLSYWCRFMLKRSHDDGRNQWCSFFYACRTAIRSRAGMPLAEFIVPLLVLDRICNGNGNDEKAVINEFLSVFDFVEYSKGSDMSHAERRKAVNCAFMVLDTLQHWAEHETEERYHSSRATSAARSARRKREEDNRSDSTCWLWEESVSSIERLLKAVPLSLQANAAAAVGMHARSLRLMEMAARAEVVQEIYDSAVNAPVDSKTNGGDRSPGGQKLIGSRVMEGIDTNLFKRVLGQLNDCETMEAMANTSDVSSSALDDIMVKESKGDWSGALYDYERALEINDDPNSRLELEQGSLRCLLELGQLESVLHQVNGIVHNRKDDHNPSSSQNDPALMASLNGSQATPFAVEAAWRLGRWSTLTQILNDFDEDDTNRRLVDSDGLYRVSLGKAMRGLHERSEPQVLASLKKARHVLMSDLSNVARDSYSRSYSYLVRLHCLREVENACEIMCNNENMNDSPRLGDIAVSSSHEGWNWNDRLAVVSGHGSSDVIDVRLALSRLAGDAELQGSLYLTVGKKARKSGLVNVAANFLSQAEACCNLQRTGVDEPSSSVSHIDDLLSSIRLQSAKLKHTSGESTAALRMLGLGNVSGMLDNDDKTLQALVLSHERNAVPGCVTNDRDRTADINRFSRRLLQSTRWMVEGGIKGGSEVIERFRIVQRLSPQWEKGYFQFAKYIDSVLVSRISALAHRLGKTGQLSSDDDAIRQAVILRDENCMKYLLMAMQQYANALRYSSKHVYQALPRVLSLWFDFTSYQPSEEKTTQSSRNQSNGETLLRYQADTNDLMSNNLTTIPAHCFYTALSQLISRVAHPNRETAMVVRSILTRVLTKHPAQAMWSLAWLLYSADTGRAATGAEIFDGAKNALLKRKDRRSSSLLGAAPTLFRYLIDIAKLKPKEGSSKTVTVKNWKGEAELIDFIPPVQEALSVSPSAADNGNAMDAFPMMVPRMRSFCSKVQIMASKAKPKKVKAFVVPAERPRRSLSAGNSHKASQPGDIGEMHFLVKQEAKGDLRKDARVQNLNNVINRLFATANGSGAGGSSRQQRRLHLRTFTVTCLSEDCGILEWVPCTDSMRNLIMQSYNPQASPFSLKRRGKRLGNYGDGMTLKAIYEKCQAVFFKNGNLQKAASMFEEACLKPHPPLLYWYFVQHFVDPHSWYEARSQFTLSCAAWSAVGHVIGLGDRHAENILVDTSSGQCVHVDFDCIFDKGLLLPKPEVVPFRLSPNMLDAFGPIGADGVYTGGLKAAMTTLRDNRDTLLSVLEPFTKDPIIDWKRQKSSQRISKSSVSDQRSLQAKKSITIIDERLKGIYNLRNPNLKKIRRTDGWSQDTDDEMMNLLPLSVEGQVHKMITEATSHENLVQLYVGWMSWC